MPKPPLLLNIAEPLRKLAVPLAKLNHDPVNPRLHDDANLATIRASLERFGQYQVLVVQKPGMIVRVGNGRLRVMRDLGWTHAACLVVDEAEADAIARGLIDNRSGDLSSWDYTALAQAVGVVRAAGDDPAALGWQPGELDFLVAASEASPSDSPTVDTGPGPGTTDVEPIVLTRDQRISWLAAFKQLCRETGGDVTEGRAVELIVTEWLQDPNRMPVRRRR